MRYQSPATDGGRSQDSTLLSRISRVRDPDDALDVNPNALGSSHLFDSPVTACLDPRGDLLCALQERDRDSHSRRVEVHRLMAENRVIRGATMAACHQIEVLAGQNPTTVERFESHVPRIEGVLGRGTL